MVNCITIPTIKIGSIGSKTAQMARKKQAIERKMSE